MTKSIYATLIIVTAAFLSAPAGGADSPTLNQILKQIDSATKDIRGVESTLTVTNTIAGEAKEQGDGQFYSNQKDKLRVEWAEPKLKTTLLTSQQIYDYDPAMQIVETYQLRSHPERKIPYMKVGFTIRGSDLERDYIVLLQQSESWNGRQTTVLDLTPKKESMQKQITRILLRLDEGNWLPVQQVVYYDASDTNYDAQYQNVVRNDNIDQDLFKSKWPKGTKTVKR